MTTSAKRVPTRYFLPLLDFLRTVGVDTGRLLAHAGLGAERFGDGGALLPGELDRFVTAARHVTGRSDLGFEAGRLIRMNSHDFLGYGMLSCETPDQVLRLVQRYYHLMNETFSFRYERTREHGTVVYTPLVAMPAATLHFMLEVLAVAHENQMRMILGPALAPYDIELSLPSPAHRARYASLAPVRFRFDARAGTGVRVVVAAALLDVPMPMPAPRLVRQVEERCDALTRRPVPDESGWGDYVMMLLREAGGGQLTLADIAGRLNVSGRTIDRHLRKEGLQFKGLSRTIRFERARELLKDERITVAQIAERLGFSDPANFSRAFKRVLGISPQEFRRSSGQRWPRAAPGGGAPAEAR